MLHSISRFLRCVSLILAVVLVIASIAGAADAMFFLVEVRRALRIVRICVRCAHVAAACRPLFFA